MYVFDTIQPGTSFGERPLTLSDDLISRWFSLYPEDRHETVMPAGMMAVILIRAFSEIVQPRPPGNVHGSQTFDIQRLPRIGETVITSIRCESKELKGERRWVRLASETRAEDGSPRFSGLMTTLWAK